MANPGYSSGIGPADLVAGVVELASPPDVYVRVTELLDEPASGAADLATVLEKDPGLTARLLKVVNSAFYGFPSQISTVSRAVTIIGVRELRDLILATAVLDTFSGLPNDIVTMDSFWRASLRCAVLSRVLASRQQREIEPIFVAGLLHEVGHLIMYRKLPELARETLLRQRYAGIDLYRAEREIFGFDYAAVGAELMRLWKLPPLLEGVVRHHLEPEQAPEFRLESALVHLALSIAELGTFEPEAVAKALPPNSPAWKFAGVDPEPFASALEAATQQYDAALGLFA